MPSNSSKSVNPSKSANAGGPSNLTATPNSPNSPGSSDAPDALDVSVRPRIGNSARPAQRNPFRSLVSTAAPGEEIGNARRLPLALIDVNPHQARQHFDEDGLDELAASIREHDVLQPIGVAHIEDRFRIIFGERRFRAAVMAEKSDIPAVIYEDLSESDAAVLTALENLQREDLDLEDEARQFAYLLDVTGLSQRALAERLGKTHNYISRRVRLLRERPELFVAIRESTLTQKEALDLMAAERGLYHGDTQSEGSDVVEEGIASSGMPGNTGAAQFPDMSSIPEEAIRQVGVYHGNTLVDLISMNERDTHTGRTPRYEMPTARAGIPARWQAITRTYRVLGKIHPEAVPIEECEDLAKQLEDLETLVATTRRALQARANSNESSEQAGDGRGLGSAAESSDSEKIF